jgi:hypothetical protein
LGILDVLQVMKWDMQRMAYNSLDQASPEVLISLLLCYKAESNISEDIMIELIHVVFKPGLYAGFIKSLRQQAAIHKSIIDL